MPILRYGFDSVVRLEFAEGVLLGEYGTPPLEPLDDPPAAVAAALQQPVEYPPLGQVTTPSDRIVLALDQGLPQGVEIAAAVIQSLVGTGVDPDGIAILRTQADADAGVEDPRSRLPDEWSQRIGLITHEAADRRELGYLAASEAGEPILLNRALTDADLVLPIGCLHGEHTADYFGIHGCIFPGFADVRTQQRFQTGAMRESRRHEHEKLTAEADHIGWLLGVNFTIQLVPAAGSAILHVVAGESESVRRRARKLYRSAWSHPTPRAASLVVATIEGGPDQQTWQNFGRALETAAAVVNEGGAIAICSDLAARPGPALQQLSHAHSRESAVRRIRKERPADVIPALQLAHAQEQSNVYLLSRLDPAAVEALDMIPIAGPDELVRLAARHRSCLLLGNAARVVLNGDG